MRRYLLFFPIYIPRNSTIVSSRKQSLPRDRCMKSRYTAFADIMSNGAAGRLGGMALPALQRSSIYF